MTSDNIHSLTLNSKNTTIENGMIKNAMIESLAFDKITGIDVNTTKLTVHSEDGKSTWRDNTIQISDVNRVRVQIGKDATGDYTLAVWDASGNLIWDALGATENTIQRKIIRDDVVADDAAISGSKLDIESVVREVNGATTKLKSTTILFDDKNQTLDVVFNEMESTVSENSETLTTHTTNISTIQGQISSLIAEDTTIKGDYNALVSKYNSTVSEVDSIKTTIGEHTTLLDSQSDKILSVQTKTNTIESDLSGTKQTISSIQSDMESTTNRVTTVETGLDGLKTRVSNTETAITKKADGTTVDNLTSRVSTCETTLDGFETSLTAVTKKVSDNEEAISTHDTRIDATEKSISLKVSTSDFESYKSTVDGEIASSKSRLSTAESSITALNGQIALKVEQTDIDTAVNGIQVGGRNLWLKTKEYNASAYTGWVDNNDGARGQTTTPYTTVNGFGVQRIAMAWGDISQRVPIEPNTDYTLSAWIKWENSIGDLMFFDNASPNSGTWIGDQVGTGEYKRVSVTFNSGNANVSTCRFECATNIPYLIYGLKLEKGNKATDWSPAPEDVDSSISAVDAKFANYSTTTQMTAAITAAKDSITQSVSATYATKSSLETANSNITSLTSRVKTAESKLTKDGLTTIVGDYYTTATVVDSKIDGIQVGGRNLATSTNQGVYGWNWSTQNSGTSTKEAVQENGIRCCKFTRTSTDIGSWSVIYYTDINRSKYEAGKKYTVSFEVKASVNTSFYCGLKLGSGTDELAYSVSYVQPNTSANTWKKCVFVLTLKDTLPTSTGQVLYLSGMNSNAGVSYIFRNLMIEEGNKASAWTPAPEDVDSSISAVQTIATQTADKFNWLVKSGTSSTDFTLTDRTAALVANAINLKGLVTFSGLDSAAQKKITTAQSTADSAKTAAANAQSTADTAKSNAATAQSTANAAKTAASNAQSTADTARNEIASLGNITVKRYGIDGASGSAKWFKLGTLVSNGDCSSTIITVYSGDGYNGIESQNSQAEIVIKDGWQPSQSATTSFGVSVTRQNCESLIVKVMASSHNTCDVWVYMPWGYWNGMYTIVGTYSSWTHSGTYQDSEPSSGVSQSVGYRANAENAQSTANLANTTLANWCYNNDKTYINGGKIYTGTIAAAQIASSAITTDKLAANSVTAAKIATDAIKSKNYAYSSGNYSTAGTFLDLSNGLIRSKNFAIDSSGNAYLKGTITATSGKIGKYDITSTYLMTGSGSGATGIGGNQAFWAGSESSNSAPFRVAYDGALVATNATISGNITATSGTIGGFTIGSSALYNNTTSLAGAANSVYLGNDGISCGTTFKVTKAGALTATSGTVGGFTLSSTELTNVANTSGIHFRYSNTSTSYDDIYIGGSNHNILVRSSDTANDERYDTVIGGDNPYAIEIRPYVKVSSGYTVDNSVFIDKNGMYKGGGKPLSLRNDWVPSTANSYNLGAFELPFSYVYTNGVRVGYSDYSAGAGFINTRWKDGATHNLLYRGTDGLTSTVGWVGSASYATVLKLNGRTVQVQNSSGTSTLSDERLKKDFRKLDAWENFYLDLEPIAYKYKDGSSGRNHMGFLAQQVEKALLNNGLTAQDFGGLIKYDVNPDDEDSWHGYKTEYGLIYTEFTALNTYMTQKTIRHQEEQDKVISLIDSKAQSEINNLKSQLASTQYQLQQAFNLIAEQNKLLKELQGTM